jgi:hypothetical protein
MRRKRQASGTEGLEGEEQQAAANFELSCRERRANRARAGEQSLPILAFRAIFFNFNINVWTSSVTWSWRDSSNLMKRWATDNIII